jgi:pSer/pThr/pTyr-binding forkhead associated (FHA) protein
VFEDSGETTMSFVPGREEVAAPQAERPPAVEGTTLVVHRAGQEAETIPVVRDRMTVGRSPDCDVFLDDVTVSRLHAVLVREGRAVFVEDQNSLNGTYINRRRVDRARLADADEMQIGKYRLTFLDR